MKPPSVRIQDACRTLENAKRRFELRSLSGDADLIAAGERLISSLETMAAELDNLATPKTDADRDLTRPQRIATLSDALEAIARERGAATLPTDSLHRLVVATLSGYERDYWARDPGGMIVGLIQTEPKLTDELKRRGILAWLFENDPLTRLVDTQWLQTHADIYAYIFGEPSPGARCRFCRLHEMDGTKFTDFRLQIDDRINTPVRVHAACYQALGNWVAIVKGYASLDAALQADVAAGRTQGAVPALPAALDPPPGPGPNFCEAP